MISSVNHSVVLRWSGCTEYYVVTIVDATWYTIMWTGLYWDTSVHDITDYFTTIRAMSGRGLCTFLISDLKSHPVTHALENECQYYRSFACQALRSLPMRCIGKLGASSYHQTHRRVTCFCLASGVRMKSGVVVEWIMYTLVHRHTVYCPRSRSAHAKKTENLPSTLI